jgi:hypothetical protein
MLTRKGDRRSRVRGCLPVRVIRWSMGPNQPFNQAVSKLSARNSVTGKGLSVLGAPILLTRKAFLSSEVVCPLPVSSLEVLA